MINKNIVLVGIAALAVLMTGALIFANSGFDTTNVLSFLQISKSKNAIAEQSINYLNKNVLEDGQVASLNTVSEESGLVKINFKITGGGGDRAFDAYVTRDGKLFFPQVIVMSGEPVAAEPTTPKVLSKVENTMLEAFIVSDCPYGLQTQRAIGEAIKGAPELAQHVKVKYIGAVSGGVITAMHGDGEAQENLRQICIREEQSAKYWDYVGCYMSKATSTLANGMPHGDTKTCQTSAGIDTTKLNSCVADKSRGLAYAQKDFDAVEKYNNTEACKADPSACAVAGSPALILNGEQISEFDFGGRSAEAFKTIVCNSSTTAPGFCEAKLSSDQASVSFAATYSPPGGGAAPASNAANCAPAN